MTEVDRAVRQDVADVLVRYATGIDRRDWALFRACFTEDCDVDALVMFDEHAGTRATGFYDDELVETDDGWRIARRRLTLVLAQMIPDGTTLDLDPMETT